ncbi:MAG: hypothetical protein R3D44_18745 [Hyphomicrobiaceae bacterium]
MANDSDKIESVNGSKRREVKARKQWTRPVVTEINTPAAAAANGSMGFDMYAQES